MNINDMSSDIPLLRLAFTFLLYGHHIAEFYVLTILLFHRFPFSTFLLGITLNFDIVIILYSDFTLELFINIFLAVQYIYFMCFLTQKSNTKIWVSTTMPMDRRFSKLVSIVCDLFTSYSRCISISNHTHLERFY